MDNITQEEWMSLLRSDMSAFNRAIASVAPVNRIMFVSADLSGMDLRMANLHYCDLTGTILRDAKVPGLALSRCRLYQTELEGAEFDDTYWQPVIQQIQMLWRNADEWNHFRKKNTPAILESACFREANLADADLSGMFFTSGDFTGADLHKCNLEGTNFLGGVLKNAVLSGAFLDHTYFEAAQMETAVLDGAIFRFTNLTKAIITGTAFNNVIFEHTDAHGLTAINCFWKNTRASNSLFFDGNFSNSSIVDTHFDHCNFNGVCFQNTVFRNASLNQCNLSGADVTTAIFENTKREDAVF